MTDQPKTKFLESWARLCANWPLAEPRATNLAKEYYEIFKTTSAIRFDAAVTQIIRDSKFQYFPTVSEFLGYIPKVDGGKGFWRDPACESCHGSGFQPKYYQADGLPVVERCKNPDCLHIGSIDEQVQWEQQRQARTERPDDYFGQADVVCLMRIAQDRKNRELPLLSADEMIAAILEIRHSCQESRPQ
jgi:hypothetical protein